MKDKTLKSTATSGSCEHLTLGRVEPEGWRQVFFFKVGKGASNLAPNHSPGSIRIQTFCYSQGPARTETGKVASQLLSPIDVGIEPIHNT